MTCSQNIRRRISGPNARFARAAAVAISTNIHNGRLHANSAIALGNPAVSSGADATKLASHGAERLIASAATQPNPVPVNRAKRTALC